MYIYIFVCGNLSSLLGDCQSFHKGLLFSLLGRSEPIPFYDALSVIEALESISTQAEEISSDQSSHTVLSVISPMTTEHIENTLERSTPSSMSETK